MEEKKQPPAPPPKAHRGTLSKANLPVNSGKTEVTSEPQEESIVEEPKVEQEQEEPWVEPTDLQNGVAIEKEQLLPGKYKYYRIWVEGGEDDIVDISIARIVETGAANIFVNYPATEQWPDKDYHAWTPAMGGLKGPAGLYKVAVYCVPSFIEKDDKWLVDPNNNTTSYDIYAEWYLLDEKQKEEIKRMEDHFKRDATNTVWTQGYSKELIDKYQKQTEEYEKENKEKTSLEQTDDVSLDGTEVAKKYTIGAELGRGDFTVVKRAKSNADGKEYALKIVNKLSTKDAGISDELLKRQTEILKKVSHPNIVKFVESFDNDKALFVITEVLEGRNIIQSLSSDNTPYTEGVAKQIVKQLLSALEYLHSKKIVHKNIVPRNILFKTKQSSDISLVGFTLSQEYKEEDELEVFGGDSGFQAPELLQRSGLGPSADMWAVGVVTYILLCGYRPFQDVNTMRLFAKIRQGSYELPDAEWKDVSNEAKDFIKKALEVDPKSRLTAKDALAHPWINGPGTNLLNGVRPNLKKYEH